VKSGACLTAIGGTVYCLKGGNTTEFWSYVCDSDRWYQRADMPLGIGKRVKGGAGMAALVSRVYALKGNNTREFFSYGSYGPAACGQLQASSFKPQARSEYSFRNPQSALRILPNPFARTATVVFSVPEAGDYRLTLYDVSGRTVRRLASGRAGAGITNHRSLLSGLAPGCYVVELSSAGRRWTEKLIVE